MGRPREDWVEIFQALGQAFFSVLRSEWRVLQERWWKGTFRNLFAALVCFGLAAFLGLILIALVITTMVLVLVYFGFAPWQATLIVAGLALLVMGIFFAIGRFVYLKKFENPAATARERFEDHLSWWREHLLRDLDALPEGKADGET